MQLRPRLLTLAPGTRIVSHDWDLGDWRPDRTLTIDVPEKKLGRDKVSRVHLWRVPAQVGGRWCAAGAELEIVQRFQRISATLTVAGRAGPATVFDGRIDGLDVVGEGSSGVAMRLDGRRLTVTSATRDVRSGAAFSRAEDSRCPT